MKYLKTYKMFELLSIRDIFNKDFVFPGEHIQNIINDVLADLMDNGIGIELTPHTSHGVPGLTLAIGEHKGNRLILWKDIRGYAQHLIKSLSEEGVKSTGIHIGTFTYDSINDIEDCFDRSTPEGKELEEPHDCIYFYFDEDKSTIKEGYEFSDIELSSHDVLRDLEDEGLFVGTKSYDNGRKIQIIVTNHDDISITNIEVFNHIKRVIRLMELEGYDRYDAVINSKNMGSDFTNWNETLDKYLALPKDRLNNRASSKNNVKKTEFEYIDMLFYRKD